MTKVELEMSLDEIRAQREILLNALSELEKSEHDLKDSELEEEPEGPAEEQNLSDLGIKKIIYNAIASGNFKNALDKIYGGIDYTRTALKSFCDIIDKTQDKLRGNIDEVPGPMGIPIMTDMWLPMFLTLLQAQEFQHLLANMFANLLKDG